MLPIRATTTGSTTPSNDIEAKALSRREFLNYVWGASIALLLAESVGAALWFAMPHRQLGREGGLFRISAKALPEIGAEPIALRDGDFWLYNSNGGLLALSGICTYRGCQIKWVPTNNRFECPCCGSKFAANGAKLIGPDKGPAPRNLDRFAIDVYTLRSVRFSPPDGAPVSIQDASYIVVDVQRKIQGKSLRRS